VRALLQLPHADEAKDHLFDPAERNASPDHLNAEVLQALRRFERIGLIDAAESAGSVAQLLELPIVRYPTLPLLHRAWALRHNFTAYDAMYVALAEAVGTRLITTDERLATAARVHSSIEVVLLGG
jgi:predicted nucleic acid-binding protein